MAREKTVLVLLPGLDGTGTLFLKTFLDALPLGLEGLVLSYPRAEKHSYDDLLSLVRERLPRDSAFVLVGESFSGPLALRLAAEDPAGLLGLAFVGSFVRSPVGNFGFLNRFLACLGRWHPPRWALRAFLTGAGDEGLVDQVAQAISSVEGRVIAHRLREVLAVDVSEEAEGWRGPVLSLIGREDKVVGGRARRHIRAHFKSVEVVELDAPHLILQRCPQEAAAAIAGFVSRLRQKNGISCDENLGRLER